MERDERKEEFATDKRLVANLQSVSSDLDDISGTLKKMLRAMDGMSAGIPGSEATFDKSASWLFANALHAEGVEVVAKHNGAGLYDLYVGGCATPLVPQMSMSRLKFVLMGMAVCAAHLRKESRERISGERRKGRLWRIFRGFF